MRSKKNNGRRYNTADLRNEHYSPEIIREYEDPEYAKQAEKYEREARRRDAIRRGRSGQHLRRSEKRGWKAEREFLRSQRNRGNSSRSGLGSMGGDLFSEGRHARTDSSFRASRGSSERHAFRSGSSGGGGNYGGGYGMDGGRGGKRRPRRRFHVGVLIRNIIILLLILAMILVAFIWSMTGNFERQDTSTADWSISDSVAQSLKGYRNIAILGSDARKGEGYDGSRTDAIIVLSIRKSDGRIRLISVMRDSYLQVGLSDGTLGLDKITHAHAYGGGVDTCASLNRSLDLNIKEYVIFDWKAVADTVDALGGVTVNVRHSELRDLNHYGNETAVNVDGHHTKITHSGRQRLDGVQAATYCRIRKTSGGDTGRARRYKTIVAAVIKEAMVSPIGLQKMSKNVLPEIRTNMTRAGMMTAILGAPGYDMEKSVAWPKSYWGGIIGGVWYAVPTTLSSDITWLHEKAFGESNYIPSAQCEEISSEIVARTGITTGNN